MVASTAITLNGPIVSSLQVSWIQRRHTCCRTKKKISIGVQHRFIPRCDEISGLSAARGHAARCFASSPRHRRWGVLS